jgi:hypothetical protein
MPVDIETGYAEIEELLREVAIPRGVRVTRSVPTPPPVVDIRAAVAIALRDVNLPRGSVAVAAGSRGIARIAAIVAAVVAELRAAGAEPFVIPAMGSHGASTAAGQAKVLADLGITEATVGAPVRATMDTVEIGRTLDGVPVFMDAFAYAADAVVVVNRVKPHTAFRGPIESGPTKMIAVGLGKQRGAHSIHAAGWGKIHQTIPAAAGVSIASGKIAFGVAIVENAHEEPAQIVAIPAADLLAREPVLQEQAKANLGRLPFDELDVLVIDRIGKNISGDGADPNVTGRYPTAYGSGGPRITRMVMCDLTVEAQGNANGVGMADVVTHRLAEKFVPPATYLNALTSTTPEPTRLPMTMPTARMALAAALLMCPGLDPLLARIVRIRDTLHLREFWVSEPLLPFVNADSSLTVAGELGPFPLAFE